MATALSVAHDTSELARFPPESRSKTMPEESNVLDTTLSPENSPGHGDQAHPNQIQTFKSMSLANISDYTLFPTTTGALSQFDYAPNLFVNNQYPSVLSVSQGWSCPALETPALNSRFSPHAAFLVSDAHSSDSSSAYSSPASQPETLFSIGESDDYRDTRCFTPFTFSNPGSPLPPGFQTCATDLSTSPTPAGWADSDMNSGMQLGFAKASQAVDKTTLQLSRLSPASDVGDVIEFHTDYPSRRATHPEISKPRRHRQLGRSHIKSIVDRFPCPWCQESFRRREKFKVHVAEKHHCSPGQLGSISANDTGKSWQQKSSLRNSLPIIDEPTCDQTSPSPPNRVKAEDNTSNQSGATILSPGQTDVHMLEQTPEPRVEQTNDKIGQSRLLACPFQKSDPQKHQECLKYELHRIKDVKQHIYRRHRQPDYYCAKCFYVFETAENRDEHARRSDCETREGPTLPQFEGISDRQKKQLNEKSCRTMDMKEQWYQMWEIVFPGQPRPRTVYLGSYLEETVPLLRILWATQGAQIMSELADVEGCKVDAAMRMFFERLEEETAGYDWNSKNSLSQMWR